MTGINKKSLLRWYWILQISGWGLYFLFNLMFILAFLDYDPAYVVGQANFTISGFFLTHLFRKYIFKYEWRNQSINKLSIQILVSSVVLALIWGLYVIPSNTLLYQFSGVETELELFKLLGMIFPMTIIVLLWLLIYFGVHTFLNFRQSQIEKWRLEAAVKDAELMALKSQINPHFIFNCLNNIRSLVIEDPGKSRDMITHLSDLLRYSIQFNNQERVTLEKELDIVKNYLELESIQYEDRLRYNLHVPDDTLDHMVPPMMVQILVENAIKHSISRLPRGGEVKIRTYLEAEDLVVEVENSGKLLESSDSTGIGLKNASERLKLLFGKLATFDIKNTPNESVVARFTLPISPI